MALPDLVHAVRGVGFRRRLVVTEEARDEWLGFRVELANAVVADIAVRDARIDRGSDFVAVEKQAVVGRKGRETLQLIVPHPILF